MELDKVKPLTAHQYDTAVKQAELRTMRQIGDRPQRKNFEMEFSPLINPLDPFLFVLFAAAFSVSATHIIRSMGVIVSTSLNSGYIGGIQIDRDFEIGLSQIAALAMNEAALIVFMVMFNFRMHQRRNSQNRSIDQKVLDIAPLVGAVIATIFIFWANWQSGLGLLSVIAPIFTAIGSIRLEEIASEKIKRNDIITRKYSEALNIFERSSANIRSHENFKKNLYEAVFSALCSSNKKNHPDMIDYDFEFKVSSVRAEMDNHEKWMEADVSVKPRKKIAQKEKPERQNGSMNTVYEFMLSHPNLNPRLNNEFTYSKAAEAISSELGYGISQSTVHKVAAKIAQNGSGK